MYTKDAQKAAKPFVAELKKALKNYCGVDLEEKPLIWNAYPAEKTYTTIKGKEKTVKLASCVFGARSVFFKRDTTKVLQGDGLYLFVTAVKGSLFKKPALIEIRVVYGIDFYPDSSYYFGDKAKASLASTIQFAKDNKYDFRPITLSPYIPEYLDFFSFRPGKHMCNFHIISNIMYVKIPDARKNGDHSVESTLDDFKKYTCEGIVKNLKSISANIGYAFMNNLK